MISSFFKKTKPINYLIVAMLVVLAMLLGFIGNYSDAETGGWYVYIINLILVMFTVLVAGIIVFENKLSGANTYVIFVFGMLLLIFPSVIFNLKVIITNLLILLAIRRLLSLHTGKNVKAKIFDAFLMLGICCFLNPWCMVFFVIGLLCILFYEYKDIRNWLTVFVVFGLLFTGYVIFKFYVEKTCVTYPFTGEFLLNKNIEIYSSTVFLVPFIFLFVMGLWAVLVFLASFQSKSIHLQKPYWILLIMLLLATFMEMGVAYDKGAAMVYLFLPLSVFITYLLEKLNNKYYKEVIIWLFLILPIIRLML